MANASVGAEQAGLYAAAFVRAMLDNLATAVLTAILLMRMTKPRADNR
ncbi:MULTISPECIES: hypothetical protein [unclassified Bradyrhizobium]|nr:MULTISPECIES: hypothetical protein [unclassified Bradyrhizobium]